MYALRPIRVLQLCFGSQRVMAGVYADFRNARQRPDSAAHTSGAIFNLFSPFGMGACTCAEKSLRTRSSVRLYTQSFLIAPRAERGSRSSTRCITENRSVMLIATMSEEQSSRWHFSHSHNIDIQIERYHIAPDPIHKIALPPSSSFNAVILLMLNVMFIPIHFVSNAA